MLVMNYYTMGYCIQLTFFDKAEEDEIVERRCQASRMKNTNYVLYMQET